ncbi:MAG: Ig-like domain-containing protein [Defluviitaleaceae bacterium]|nr:Ig-like domain-containing protein [Defluviitaleaceae bacterium]
MKKIIAGTVAGILIIFGLFVFLRGEEEDSPILDMQDFQAAERMFNVQPLGHLGESELLIEAGQVLEGHLPRDGYTLAPTMFGLTGVDSLSSFVLRTPTASLPAIYIDGQPSPRIVQEDGNTFIISPEIPFNYNRVYVFRLVRENLEDITWAFQTAARFEITSTFPRHQSVNVPVRTGIEITFSYGEEIDISESFTIHPHVDGQFISRGSTAIFTPSSPLEFATVYTVTVMDRIFSFETAPEATIPARSDRMANVHFINSYVEFPTFATPSVHFWLSYQHNRPSVEMTVYRIDDREAAILAVNQISGNHFWSHFFSREVSMDTSGLTRISRTVVSEPNLDEGHWNETFVLPQNLSAGFYLLNASTDNSEESSQAIIQIKDISVQLIADDERVLVWVNDMGTGRPAAASVFDPIGNRTYTATSYGIAVVERSVQMGEHLIVSANGMESVVFATSFGQQHFWADWHFPTARFNMDWDMDRPMPIWFANDASRNYWSALQLDRTLFQRSDTVSLWGFVQNRHEAEDISHVTAVLTTRSWWWWDDGNTPDILVRQNFAVRNGAYSGEIRLPNLDPSDYVLTIYHGDIALDTIFISVMDYVKPPYQLIVSADRRAVFAGEEINFSARTEFFEGTPVPDLAISYNTWGWQLRMPGGYGRGSTDMNGEIQMSATPVAENATVQGHRTLRFAAEATLPEIGFVHESLPVRVFINDIYVNPRASREGVNATLSLDVNQITLDRINNGTAEHWGDFLCEPVSRQNFSVSIVETWWERVPEGEFYCHVRRQMTTRYRHVERRNTLETFEMTTNAEGFAERNFTVPNIEQRTYTARITTTDGNGRTITHDVFIGRDWARFFDIAGDDMLFLYGENDEGYDIGDDVRLTVMRGTEPVTQGNFLFVVVQGDILSYHIGTNPLEFTFSEQHVPNAQVFAYHFNGHTISTGGQMAHRLRYNPAQRELIVNVSTCQIAYRPGDVPTFIITTTYPDGTPTAANVNLSLVDEALFALMDYNVDTLAMLYRNIGDNLRLSSATHRTFFSTGINDFVGQTDSALYGGGLRQSTMYAAPFAAAESAEDSMVGGAPDGGGNHIRERFEDTAIFASVRTDDRGEARITFPLPDNITSWRVTASAINENLFAGNTVKNIRVTLPMFLHYTLNNTFLVGDIPTIGLNAYGTGLSAGDIIHFSVWRENAPDDVRTATGAAFERVNIPLWEKTEDGALLIQAMDDTVRHEYRVLDSHRKVDTATFYDNVTTQTVFQTNETGMTNITFTDRGRGQFLNALFDLRHTWRSGARIEGLVARREAGAILSAHFADIPLSDHHGNFDILDYQVESGGIAILPYAEAELEVTVKLIPFIKDEINLPALRNYLQNIAIASQTDNKMLALYGLALLGEPVLLELQRYAMLEDLSIRNNAYVALGLAALGEMQTARNIYNERIAPYIQNIAPYHRVNVGANNLEILDTTSVTALLAAKLSKPEAIGLHNYAVNARASLILPTINGRLDSAGLNAMLLLNLERLNFISREITNHSAATSSITYTLFGETITRELNHGGRYTLRIPVQNMHNFQIISTTGEVSAVSITRTPLEDLEPTETGITIRRQFFRAGTNTPATSFTQDELVRVQITVTYAATDIVGTYVVTDFLPAGLVHVENSAHFGRNHRSTPGRYRAWATTEGPRITFFDHNSTARRSQTYYYYARVINPGTFRAEGTMVQSLGAREFLVVGEDDVLVIS